jgi:gamma-glutamyltranspeptidase
MTLEDFRRYKPIVYEDRLMVRLDDNLRVYAPPPPSSGIFLPTIMRIMKSILENNNKKI